MKANLQHIKWRSRTDALLPGAVVVFDLASALMARKLLSFDDEKLGSFNGVSSRNMLLITGDSGSLPWTDGAIYLGRDARIPDVLLPSTIRPDCPLELFGRLLNQNFRHLAPLAALPARIIACGGSKPLSRRVLENWLANNIIPDAESQ